MNDVFNGNDPVPVLQLCEHLWGILSRTLNLWIWKPVRFVPKNTRSIGVAPNYRGFTMRMKEEWIEGVIFYGPEHASFLDHLHWKPTMKDHHLEQKMKGYLSMKSALFLTMRRHANEISSWNAALTPPTWRLFSTAVQSLWEYHMQQDLQSCSVNHAMAALVPLLPLPITELKTKQ